MHHNTTPLPMRALCLLALVFLLSGLPASALAQDALSGAIASVGNSNVRGDMSLGADARGFAYITVHLIGLVPGGIATVHLNAGTCSQPSASFLQLFFLTADGTGQATANGPFVNRDGTPMKLPDVTDGEHIISIVGATGAVACGQIPGATGGPSLGTVLLQEGELRQIMQFNPDAALQKRIFADGFVPNSAEFTSVLEATTFVVQRAEHMRTGAVRAYFVRVGDWGNVRYAERGLSTDALGRYLLNEAEKNQVIRFNPNAALQRRIFADGFVPNSGEFAITAAGTNYTGQRAEHLQTGRVRVYYAVTGQWNNVRLVERGATNPPSPNLPPPPPVVTISPRSGPPGTMVQVIGYNFGYQVGVTLWAAPVGSEGVQVANAVTDASGRVVFNVPIQGASGMRWVFGLVSGEQHAESQEFTITG